MANISAPFGMRPVRHKSGAPYSGACRLYYSTGATALYIGDPVIVTSSGAASSAYQGTPIGAAPTVVVATAGTGNALTGVVVGFFPEQATSTVYGASGANRGVFVCDDPEIIYEVMDDGVAALTVAAVSAGGNLNSSAFSGSTTTALSGFTMSSTTATATGDQLKIISLAERPNNVVGKLAVWEVMINNHTLVAGTAGI